MFVQTCTNQFTMSGTETDGLLDLRHHLYCAKVYRSQELRGNLCQTLKDWQRSHLNPATKLDFWSSQTWPKDLKHDIIDSMIILITMGLQTPTYNANSILQIDYDYEHLHESITSRFPKHISAYFACSSFWATFVKLSLWPKWLSGRIEWQRRARGLRDFAPETSQLRWGPAFWN